MRKGFVYSAIFVLFSGIALVLVFNSVTEGWLERYEADYQESLLLQASPKTPAYLKQQFENSSEKLKILIVPGHDNESVGSAFAGLKEADLTLEVGQFLFELFKNDSRFEPFIVRDEKGYKKEFADYFQNNRQEISAFRERFKNVMNLAFDVGILKREEGVSHNSADEETSIKLYGINKWANENDADLVLHLHFNDYPGHGRRPGRYSGFSIYAPEKQLPNSKASLDIAESVFEKIKKYFAVSDYPPESEGIVEDQSLIALGANGSLDSPALLIEYGYIYESPFLSREIAPYVLREMALQTYAGVNQYFMREVISQNGYDTFLLPYFWGNSLEFGLKNKRDVLALQAALAEEGVYPPSGFSSRECPLTGSFLECTKKAVAAFQEKYKDEILVPLDLTSGTGFLGDLTLKKLNELYGRR